MNYWDEWEGFGQEYPDQAPQPEEQKQPGWYPEQRGSYEMYWDDKEYTQIRSAQAPQQAEPTQQTTRKNYTTTPLAAPIEPTQTHSEAPKAPQIAASQAADLMPSYGRAAVSEKPELPRHRWWHDAPETWTQRVQPAQPVQTPAASPDPVPRWRKQQPASPMKLLTAGAGQVQPIVPGGCVQTSQNPLKGLTKNQKIIGAVIAGVVGVVLLLALIIGVAANSHSDAYYACVKANSAEFNRFGDPEIQDSLESYCAQLEDMGMVE
jgi:hypothetical protein